MERGHSRGIENAPKAFIGLMKGKILENFLLKLNYNFIHQTLL